MKWLEIRIITTEEASDAISEMLTSIGAGGVAIEDPNEIRREISKPNSLDYADEEFMNSLGVDVIIKSYFPGNLNITELVELIKEKISFISAFLETGHGYDGYTEVDDEDWSTAWKKYYKPVHISESVVIKPSWESYTAKEGEITVELDPGMAFGTGTHETTMMCAQLLEEYIKQGDKVLDIGCGTGILAIIASKLGAEGITAVDIDEVAVKVTKENCQLNDVYNVNVFRGVLDDIERQKADIVVANIIANVIIDISKTIPYYVKANAYFITSGIIRERKQEVMDSYLQLGFSCEKTLEIGEWVAMVFKCQNSL
ncbi:MAG: 50S ribosomal protein L11 methyltransferase [Clostridia bacterium]|nr:50S ribosomal protein L11 methyltransferase [Clostridia bacterium]